MARGDRVELRGFGAFSVKQRPARTGRNPRTGAHVPVDQKVRAVLQDRQGNARAAQSADEPTGLIRRSFDQRQVQRAAQDSLRRIILVPLAVVIIAFAMANRQNVTVSFDPFNAAEPALR